MAELCYYIIEYPSLSKPIQGPPIKYGFTIALQAVYFLTKALGTRMGFTEYHFYGNIASMTPVHFTFNGALWVHTSGVGHSSNPKNHQQKFQTNLMRNSIVIAILSSC